MGDKVQNQDATFTCVSAFLEKAFVVHWSWGHMLGFNFFSYLLQPGFGKLCKLRVSESKLCALFFSCQLCTGKHSENHVNCGLCARVTARKKKYITHRTKCLQAKAKRKSTQFTLVFIS